jgi:MFS family permease
MTVATKPGPIGRLLSLPQAELILLINAFIVSIGIGLYAAASVIYFTRFAGVSAGHVGLAMSIAAVVWLVIASTVGKMIDRLGPRDMMVTFGVLNAVLIVSLIFAHGFIACLLLLCALGIAENSNWVARSAVVGNILERKRRVLVSARNRSASNAGLALGNGLAGLVLIFNTKSAFNILLLGFAATLLTVAMLSLRLPRVRGTRSHAERRGSVLWEKRAFLGVSVLCGLITIHDTVLVIGLPLWIVENTSAPRPLASWLLILNTVLVVLFQVRAAKGADDVAGAKRVQVQACLLMAISCAVLGFSGYSQGVVLTVAVLLVGVGLLTLAELRAAAGGWGLRYALAKTDEQAVYGAIFSMGSTARLIIGPALVTFLTSSWHLAGWLLLALLFALLAVATPPLVAWADKSRGSEVAG